MDFEILELKGEAVLVYDGMDLRKFSQRGGELYEDVPSIEVFVNLCKFQKPDIVKASCLGTAVDTYLKAQILA